MKFKLFIVVIMLLLSIILFLSCSKNAALTSGKLYLKQENLEKAQEQLEVAVGQIPQDWEVHFLLGVVFGKKKMYEEMNREFAEVIQLNPAKEPIVNRGDGRYWIGRETLWIEWYNDGITYLNEKKFEKAVEYFAGATRIWPEKGKAFSQLGYVYSILGRNDEALEASEKAVELSPNEAQYHFNLAVTYFNLEKFDEAIDAYKKVIELEPDRADAWMYLAQTYEQMENYDEAIEAYTKAIELKPDEKDLYYNLGVLYSHRDDFENAAVHFQKAVELDDADIDANYNLGLVHFNLEQYDEALPLLKRAVELDPMHADAWDALGIIYVKKGEIEKGKEALEKAKKIKGEEGIEIEEVSSKPRITIDEYQQIKIGMTYPEVVDILGSQGRESARSEGVVIYEWSNPDGSGISVTFLDGKVSTKAQAGL